MSFYVGMFLGFIFGSLSVLLLNYVIRLQNKVFDLSQEVNLERCVNWQNVEHYSRVRRRNLKERAASV